jgi:hypothetical protein
MPVRGRSLVSGRWQGWRVNVWPAVQQLSDARVKVARERVHSSVTHFEQRIDILRGSVARDGNANLQRPRLPIHGKRYGLPKPDVSGIRPLNSMERCGDTVLYAMPPNPACCMTERTSRAIWSP